MGGRTGTAFGMTELGTYATFTDTDAGLEVLAESIGGPKPATSCDLPTATARRRPAVGKARSRPAEAGS